ncbi:sulfur carrier protein ThiS adenylyltransferase ThiF [Peptostreptococcus equinus]|uniref:Sulfur carrier protein ThiS adenylyltransferase ThiF n=1 Tax=Peptostreptococcus equinus TaxID=3003601 RepID=A0ABY7JPV9_9FIRM|nr:sulfur carrier protein ThiS adenylyltransferase ThiF [Peptostreptococcus sp. CBA3647]WAW14931.1 sulfur carrier protein ThiS adenylyltransferase ThiF [Peptostreptococcus sp. CBA3647]
MEKILVNGKKIDEKMLLERNIENSYEKLKNTKVCILGLGGLGSNISLFLVRSGVGNLSLIDFDSVEASNLNRQAYFIKHIGMKKTDAIKELIENINPFINVQYKNIYVDEDNILDIISDYDYIIEAFDNATIKALVINKIIENYPEKIIISSSGMAGIEDSNNIKTQKRLKNLYICGDQYSDFEEYSGMMAPRVNICAGHQANMFLRLVLKNKINL